MALVAPLASTTEVAPVKLWQAPLLILPAAAPKIPPVAAPMAVALATPLTLQPSSLTPQVTP